MLPTFPFSFPHIMATGPDSGPWLQVLLAVGAAVATVVVLRQIDEARQSQSRHERPKITATLSAGFCGESELQISRLPVGGADASSWDTLFGTLHRAGIRVAVEDGELVASGKSLEEVIATASSSSKRAQEARLSRTSFMTLLVLTNARPVFTFADAAGFRANYASWIGQWYVNWPIGGTATVTLRPHDSHAPDTDVYPPTFKARVESCIHMMAGIVVCRLPGGYGKGGPATLKVAFPSRVEPGTWRLEHKAKGFAGSHGSRHIYNMNGGKVYDVDYLHMRRIVDGEKKERRTSTPEGTANFSLTIPSSENGKFVTLLVGSAEQRILNQVLDHLPWSFMSWSIHRGMRDILVAYSKPTMALYRQELARKLRQASRDHQLELAAMGWDQDFVKYYMGDLAASAVLAERGNSGDMVRIVTSLAEVLAKGLRGGLDETDAWRGTERVQEQDGGGLDKDGLDAEAIVALVKCVVLEWSIDFDYQMYHDIPIDMVLA